MRNNIGEYVEFEEVIDNLATNEKSELTECICAETIQSSDAHDPMSFGTFTFKFGN